VARLEGEVAFATSADSEGAATRDRVAARLVGREPELELVVSAVAAGRDILLEEPPGTGRTTVERLIANHGAGMLLAIEGPPGIGKTALIAEAKALGQEAGLQVLGARGSELERAFSYGVVRQLFEPFLASLSDEEQAELLAGAAGLATPLFDPVRLAAGPTADSSLAALHGLYWLTANVASRGRLLLAVDDLHWCDLPSLRWLAYLLPRMEGLDVSVLVGLRPSEPGEDPGLLGQIVSDPLASVVEPAPLSSEAAARLVRETLPDADDAFCAACHQTTGGNPLLLRELVHAVTAEGLAPTEEHVRRLRELEARAGSRTLSLRLSRLPLEATRLARAVAVLGDDVDARHAAALADLEDDDAARAAAALARVDILRPQPPFGFVHQLIRAAVYETLTPAERDSGHARAAQLLEAAGAQPERVAAQLLRAPASGDRRVVAMLREAAHEARSRGAAESTAAYLRRALAEPPPAAERAELLLELGSAEALVSGDAAIEHLQQAHGLLDDPIHRAECALLLGYQLLLFSHGDESDAGLTQALDELAGADAELERLLEAVLIMNAMVEPSLYQQGLERLERLRGRSGDATVGEKTLLALLAFHDARAGAPAEVVVPLTRRALAEGTLIREAPGSTGVLAASVLALADLDDAVVAYDDALAEAQRRGSIYISATAKGFRAQTFVWRGELAEAEAECREALGECETWGTPWRLEAYLAAFLGDALMEQGKLDDAAAALARAGSEPVPDSAALLFLRDSWARHRLLSGDLAGGMEELLAAGRLFEAVGGRNPALLAWRSQAALALLQLGEHDEARRLAAEELELARTWGAPRALGAALRAAGLAQGGQDGLALLQEAVDVLKDSPAKLEHAKARTELGAALRRAKHRAQAREQLRQGLELATLCGAAPLAARAETELLATGARPRRISLSGVASLTPSERRVAQMAADGPTNREIAQTLFVTPRTVEVHLTSIYRKLDINSRAQLAAALTAPAAA
jgi:DNA-binding CsgD family transcriptional regulator/tetratricopeptide (TPR) repeat protein